MTLLLSVRLNSFICSCHERKNSSSRFPIDGSTYTCKPFGVTLLSIHFVRNAACDSYLAALSCSLSSLNARCSFSLLSCVELMIVSMETLTPLTLSDGIPPSLNPPSLRSVSDAVGVVLLSLFADALRCVSPAVSSRSSCVRSLFSFSF